MTRTKDRAKLPPPISQARWNRLKPATRRIKIAEDVLATLALPRGKRFIVSPGTYCTMDNPKPTTGTAELRDLLPKLEKTCRVCAMGALFLSRVRLIDRFEVSMEEEEMGIGDYTIVASLNGTFSEGDLRNIERAFEGWPPYSAWKDALPNPTARLKAICQNIIKHKGDFDINDVPKGAKK